MGKVKGKSVVEVLHAVRRVLHDFTVTASPSPKRASREILANNGSKRNYGLPASEEEPRRLKVTKNIMSSVNTITL
jgi:hypothetical protein